MDADKFVYWLQGFVELANTDTLSPAQWQMIKEHLALVFKKVTPPLDLPPVTPLPQLPLPFTEWPRIPSRYQPQWPDYVQPRIIC